MREMGAHVTVDGKGVDIDDKARRFAPDGVIDATTGAAGGDALEKWHQCASARWAGWRIRMALS